MFESHGFSGEIKGFDDCFEFIHKLICFSNFFSLCHYFIDQRLFDQRFRTCINLLHNLILISNIYSRQTDSIWQILESLIRQDRETESNKVTNRASPSEHQKPDFPLRVSTVV